MRHVALALVVLLQLACSAFADTTLDLASSFVETHKNRGTIIAEFSVKFSHSKPKTPTPSKPANDGDIHISGTAPEIGLLTVAEMMNAKDFPTVIKFVGNQKGGPPVTMVGVWRIWPEHGGDSVHVQGQADPDEITDTNPDHVFEVHPLLRVGPFDVSSGFHPIPKFKTKDAELAFHDYESARSTITPHTDTISIRMSQVGQNYVEFQLELLEDPSHELDDGGFAVFGRARTLDGETVVQKRRFIFIGGTKPELAVRMLAKGQCVHALGMPRVNLSLVSWRVACSRNQVPDTPNCSSRFPDVLEWGLPYEIVVLADYGGSRKCD